LFSFVFNIFHSVLVDGLGVWMLIKFGSVFCLFVRREEGKF